MPEGIPRGAAEGRGCAACVAAAGAGFQVMAPEGMPRCCAARELGVALAFGVCWCVLRGDALFPLGGDAAGASLGHLDEGEALEDADAEFVVFGSPHFEAEPEGGAAGFFDAAVYFHVVGEVGGAMVVDFVSHEDGVPALFGEFGVVDAEGRGHFGAAFFDPAQVGEVVHDAAAVGVVVHDLVGEGVLGCHGVGRVCGCRG